MHALCRNNDVSRHTTMRKLSTILLLVLNCQVALGTTIIPTDYVQVAPTNATNYGISIGYDPTSNWVTVTMPYKKGEMKFDEASLELTNSTQHFYIPIKGMQVADVLVGDNKPQDMLLIGFRMDRQTLGESVLKIFIAKGLEKGVEYIILPKDFIANRKAPRN